MDEIETHRISVDMLAVMSSTTALGQELNLLIGEQARRAERLGTTIQTSRQQAMTSAETWARRHNIRAS